MDHIENKQNTSVIRRFRGDHEFLSNFYPAKLMYDGIPYYNAEAAYQAQKCSDPTQRQLFSALYSDESKRFGRSLSVREDWDEIKLTVMEQIVQAKFEQNPRLAQLLLSTGDMLLLEGNTWHDVFWGINLKTGEGENHLGRILMRLRESFRENGVPDRSGLRPVREYRPVPRLILTDEALGDIDAECIVTETDKKTCSALAIGDALLKNEPAFGALRTIAVLSPVYGKDDEILLNACYTNSLDLAVSHRIKRIVFPAISVGKKCFPKRKAAQIAMDSVMGWLRRNPDAELQIWLAPEDPRILGFMLE